MKTKSKNIFSKTFLFLWDDRFKFESNLEISRKLMMLNYVVLAAGFFLLPFGILSFVQGHQIIGVLDLAAALIITASIIYYKKTLNYSFLTYVIVSVLGLLFLYLLVSAGVDYSGPLWAFVFPASVMFLLGRKKGRTFSLVFIGVVIIFFVLDFSKDVYSLNLKLRFVGAFSAISVISYYVEQVRETMSDLFQQKTNDLEKSLLKLGKQEDELSEKELYYRTLFESSNDAILIMDQEKFIECNPKTLEMFACTKEEIINQSPLKFSPELQPDGQLSKDKAGLKINSALEGKNQFFEWVHKRYDGRYFNAEVSLDIIKLDNKKLIQASVRDITNRKIVEEELLIAKEQAEKSDRLKSDFLAQMSHEIRTPINTIMNYTALLKMEFEDLVSEDNSGSFKSIHNAAHRLLRTIDLILNISDVEAGTYDPMFEIKNLSTDIILPVVDEFTQAAENKNLKLIFRNLVQEDPITEFDTYTLNQTIANLVDNSIKYTEEGEVVVSLERVNKHYLIIISDSGVGIKKEYIPSLFDKFSQEEEGYTRRYEGSGLGLALVKKYCEINKISINVKSKKGEGTSFLLQIPIKEFKQPIDIA